MEVTMKTKIDINSWKRKKQFIFFSNFTNPYASVTSILDVDKIVKISKKNVEMWITHVDFFHFIHFFMQCIKINSCV